MTVFPLGGWNADVPQARRSCGVWGEGQKGRRSRGVKFGRFLHVEVQEIYTN